MTETEAKKILDWLCVRWAKKIQHFYKTQKSMDMAVKMSDERCLVSDYNVFELVFEVVFFDDYERVESKFNFNSRLVYGDDQVEILKAKSGSKSQFADVLESVFFLNKHNVWVEGWDRYGINFIDAGESLEEILVKMDLEDFDD